MRWAPCLYRLEPMLCQWNALPWIDQLLHMLEHLAARGGPYTVAQPVTARKHRWAELEIKESKHFSCIWNPPMDVLRQVFQVTIESDWPIISPTSLAYSLQLSIDGIGIQELFIVCWAAAACVLILNCGTQSVTAICLSSRISLSFRLSEIKILIKIVSQGEEVNRGKGVGMLFEFKLNIQY